jgi:hypothetical protein
VTESVRLYTADDIVRRLGIPRSTFYGWCQRARETEGYVKPHAFTEHKNPSGIVYQRFWTKDQASQMIANYLKWSAGKDNQKNLTRLRKNALARITRAKTAGDKDREEKALAWLIEIEAKRTKK